MASSSHTPAFHHGHHPAHSLHALLRNRFSLRDFHAALESLKRAWGYYEEGGYQKLKEQFPVIEAVIATPHFGWATLSLESRHKLITEVLPELERSVGLPVEKRKSLLTIRSISADLSVEIQTPKGRGEIKSRALASLELMEQVADAHSNLRLFSKELLADLTENERSVLNKLWSTAPGQYTPEQQLLIAVYEAQDQAQYERIHPLPLSPLMHGRPPISSHSFEGSRPFIGAVHSAIAEITNEHLDPVFGAAWEWVMTREFDGVCLASLAIEERTRLMKYLFACREGKSPIYPDPEYILRLALDHPPRPPPVPSHSTMHALAHFHRRLSARQAALYGTTPQEFREEGEFV
ncbi:hypothetical protein JCM6882_003588 [Rhodosporidiobolus microsporus]